MKKLFFLLMIFLFSINVFSQEYKQENKKIDIIYTLSNKNVINEIKCLIIYFENDTIFYRKIALNSAGEYMGFYNKIDTITKEYVYDLKINNSEFQNKPNFYTTSIGNEFLKYKKLSDVSTVFYCAGSLLLISPYFLSSIKLNNNIKNYNDELDKRLKLNKILTGGGVGMFLIGAIFQINANNHMEIAGHVINFQAERNQIGLKIQINK